MPTVMKTVNNKFFPVTHFRLPIIIIFIMVASGFSILPASGQNPWLESNSPLIDEEPQSKSIDNTWSGKADSEAENAVDESKYPPMDENVTLRTGPYGLPVEVDDPIASFPTADDTDLQYPEVPVYRPTPIYPGTQQRNMSGYYGNNQYPQYGSGYQSTYPGYRRGYGPGYGNMGGFPFGGSSGNRFPFGGGNSWMPFSDSGFW